MSPTKNQTGGNPTSPTMNSPTGSIDSGIGGLNSAGNGDFTIIVDGSVVNASTLDQMGRQLQEARAREEFPITTTPLYDTRATLKDYSMLMRLKMVTAGVPRSEWNRHENIARLYVEITRAIRERDGINVDSLESATTHARISTIQDRVSRDAEVYDVVNHALRMNAGPQGSMREMVRKEIRAALRGLAATGAHGLTNANAEAITDNAMASLEKMPGGIAGVLGSLSDHDNRQAEHDNRQSEHDNRMAAHDKMLDRQVRVIGQHVNAIEGNTNAMGQNVNSMSNLLNAINTNLSATGNQVESLQTLIRLLPELITDIAQQSMAQAIEAALHARAREQRRQEPKQGVMAKVSGLFKREGNRNTQRVGAAI